jgi:hypothetical protein
MRRPEQYRSNYRANDGIRLPITWTTSCRLYQNIRVQTPMAVTAGLQLLRLQCHQAHALVSWPWPPPHPVHDAHVRVRARAPNAPPPRGCCSWRGSSLASTFTVPVPVPVPAPRCRCRRRYAMPRRRTYDVVVTLLQRLLLDELLEHLVNAQQPVGGQGDADDDQRRYVASHHVARCSTAPDGCHGRPNGVRVRLS